MPKVYWTAHHAVHPNVTSDILLRIQEKYKEGKWPPAIVYDKTLAYSWAWQAVDDIRICVCVRLCECMFCFDAYMICILYILCICIYTWAFPFIVCSRFSKEKGSTWTNHTPESYPRIIPRIIPPNHTPGPKSNLSVRARIKRK